MAAAKKTVLVTGDLIVDHHIYEGERPTPDSPEAIGTQLVRVVGGAALVHEILARLGKSSEKGNGFAAELGSKKTTNLPPSLHGYAMWRSFPKFGGSADRVWRLSRKLGYGAPPLGAEAITRLFERSTDSRPEILVVDDGALGFRYRTAAKSWHAAIRKQAHRDLEWIVLKMSSPVAQGDLWHAIGDELRQKLVLLVSIEDLRREEVRVSRGSSWERTALELVDALRVHPTLRGLRSSRHLIVTLGMEGALWVHKNQERLLFDIAHMEGEWAGNFQGDVLGLMSCLTAGVVSRLVVSGEAELEQGIRGGLAAMRQLLESGHGKVDSQEPAFPFDDVVASIREPRIALTACDVPRSSSIGSSWTVLAGYPKGKSPSEPLFGIARRVALLGPKAFANVPYARFGKLLTVTRNEIESLRSLSQLVSDYVRADWGKKPLSIAAFGPPGSGKSFSIKQIAISLLGDNVPFLEFNLSQFAGTRDLVGAFHQVRDKVLEGKTPFVFWDEFDSKDYEWLQYLLAPMQDGKFQEGQLSHPIGKCIFVFAGATSYNMENFGRQRDPETSERFKLLKGPDFISRLSGHLDVLGPNRKQIQSARTEDWEDDPSDIGFPIRRALLIRAALGLFGDERLYIDRAVLSALLEIDRYHHGARSLDAVLSHMKSRGESSILTRSDLPPDELLAMHVDLERFTQIQNRDVAFKLNANEIASSVHDFYREYGKAQGWKTQYPGPFDELPEDIKEDNRAAAARIPQVLELADLYVLPIDFPGADRKSATRELIEEHIELLAEAEHEGWMEHKLKNGWRWGNPRNDRKQIHPALRPFGELDEADRDKDRNVVRKYPEILEKAGYRILIGTVEKPRSRVSNGRSSGEMESRRAKASARRSRRRHRPSQA